MTKKQLYLKTKTNILIPVELSPMHFGNNGRIELINDYLGLSIVGHVDVLHAALAEATRVMEHRNIAQVIDFTEAAARLRARGNDNA